MRTIDEKTFLELLEKKAGLVQDILTYAEEQNRLICRKQAVRYNNIMMKRLSCLERIKKLDALLNNYLEQVVKPEAALTSQLTIFEKNIKELIQQINLIDEQNKRQLALEREQIKDRLRSLRTGRRGTFLYLSTGKTNFAGARLDARR